MGTRCWSAKVFFSIFSDGAKIIDLEIRYKGSYTANPQFQTVATPDFKKIFKENVQIKPHLPMLLEGKEGKNLHLEHIEDEILNFGVPTGRVLQSILFVHLEICSLVNLGLQST